MTYIKTPDEIAIMKEGGKILGQILNKLAEAVKPGVTTKSLDDLARFLVNDFKVQPSFLGYNDFPAVLCVSLNEEVVHGIPSDRAIEDGDLIKLDMGIVHGGFHTDSAVTVIAGKKDQEKQKLINVAKAALEMGISKARPGNTTGDIGQAIQEYVEAEGFNVPRELIGHGIGRNLHEPPEIPNYGRKGEGTELKLGMVIAIEPMVLAGSKNVKEKKSVFVTKDGSLAAHFEHTVAITDTGPLILTK